jgi:hypothetical protein
MSGDRGTDESSTGLVRKTEGIDGAAHVLRGQHRRPAGRSAAGAGYPHHLQRDRSMRGMRPSGALPSREGAMVIFSRSLWLPYRHPGATRPEWVGLRRVDAHGLRGREVCRA